MSQLQSISQVGTVAVLDWKSSCAFQRVLQVDDYGCGVACLAMLVGKSYEIARETFLRLGFGPDRPRREPFSSNFKELIAALHEHGLNARMLRWKGWEHVSGTGIIKVRSGGDSPATDWHWVVAESHPLYGVVVHDPLQWALPTFAVHPMDTLTRPLSELTPYGNWIVIERQR